MPHAPHSPLVAPLPLLLPLALSDNPPDTFCWDYLCGDERHNTQVQDRDDLEDKNVDQRVADFIAAAYYMASFRKGDLATMNIMWSASSHSLR